jgi:iron complex transport system ATP-binding protein
MVLVTHHVEEIPPAFTDVLALRDGRVLGRGPLVDTLDAELLGDCFGVRLSLERHDDGRWSARRRTT